MPNFGEYKFTFPLLRPTHRVTCLFTGIRIGGISCFHTAKKITSILLKSFIIFILSTIFTHHLLQLIPPISSYPPQNYLTSTLPSLDGPLEPNDPPRSPNSTTNYPLSLSNPTPLPPLSISVSSFSSIHRSPPNLTNLCSGERLHCSR